tara:strand:+ start:12262 stop:12516 length:255 start_codon:yes stop_codon:yes gene_type:complete
MVFLAIIALGLLFTMNGQKRPTDVYNMSAEEFTALHAELANVQAELAGVAQSVTASTRSHLLADIFELLYWLATFFSELTGISQ